MPNKKPYKEGSVHGRFQPPHYGHQEYILAALEQCDFLWIGIARYDIRDNFHCDYAKHREARFNNPLTYFERIQIITEMLVDKGIDKDSFGFIPFPIDQPERLPDFLPTYIPCFTTIYDDWNRYKIKELEKVGYKVIVLWERKIKEYTGQEMRESIQQGTDIWKKMVPAATQRAVVTYNLRERLTELTIE